jgi:hypothetical protein
MQQLIEWLETHQLPCYYKKFLGIECLGCGMQTAFILLLKGEIIESLKVYPALIPILFMLAFLILHLIVKFSNGARILKISFIFTLSIMVVSYIIKLLAH